MFLTIKHDIDIRIARAGAYIHLRQSDGTLDPYVHISASFVCVCVLFSTDVLGRAYKHKSKHQPEYAREHACHMLYR